MNDTRLVKSFRLYALGFRQNNKWLFPRLNFLRSIEQVKLRYFTRSAFSVQRSAFSVQRSALSVRRYALRVLNRNKPTCENYYLFRFLFCPFSSVRNKTAPSILSRTVRTTRIR